MEVELIFILADFDITYGAGRTKTIEPVVAYGKTQADQNGKHQDKSNCPTQSGSLFQSNLTLLRLTGI